MCPLCLAHDKTPPRLQFSMSEHSSVCTAYLHTHSGASTVFLFGSSEVLRSGLVAELA